MIASEPLLSPSKADQLTQLVHSQPPPPPPPPPPLVRVCVCVAAGLQEKLAQTQSKPYYLFKVLRAHILPLTNVAFNKSGSW